MQGLGQYSNRLMSVKKFESKEDCIRQLSTLDFDTLKILAELSLKPGIETKLKKNVVMLKTFL
jgi:hypothetical protein